MKHESLRAPAPRLALRACSCRDDCEEEEIDLICRKCGDIFAAHKCLDPHDLQCWNCGSKEIEEI